MSLGFVVFILCGSGGTIYQAHSIEHTYYALLMHWPIEQSYIFAQLNEQAAPHRKSTTHKRSDEQEPQPIRELPGEPATATLYFLGITILIVYFLLRQRPRR